jgi:hypothetical protein
VSWIGQQSVWNFGILTAKSFREIPDVEMPKLDWSPRKKLEPRAAEARRRNGNVLFLTHD